MKKIALLFCLMLLISGCTKSYRTVEEYAEDMIAARKETPLKVEANFETDVTDVLVTSYIKNDKWKTEARLSMDAPVSTVMFDGEEIISYDEISPIATVVMDKNALAKNSQGALIAGINPAYYITDWYDGISAKTVKKAGKNKAKKIKKSKKVKSAVFAKKNAKKNGFACRLIKYGEETELCVSDKYGIAVYYKTSYKVGDDEETLVINVTKISDSEISDSIFQIPEGMEIYNINQALEEANKEAEKANEELEKLNKEIEKKAEQAQKTLNELDDFDEDIEEYNFEYSEEQEEDNDAIDYEQLGRDMENVIIQINKDVDVKQIMNAVQQVDTMIKK